MSRVRAVSCSLALLQVSPFPSLPTPGDLQPGSTATTSTMWDSLLGPSLATTNGIRAPNSVAEDAVRAVLLFLSEAISYIYHVKNIGAKDSPGTTMMPHNNNEDDDNERGTFLPCDKWQD